MSKVARFSDASSTEEDSKEGASRDGEMNLMNFTRARRRPTLQNNVGHKTLIVVYEYGKDEDPK